MSSGILQRSVHKFSTKTMTLVLLLGATILLYLREILGVNVPLLPGFFLYVVALLCAARSRSILHFSIVLVAVSLAVGFYVSHLKGRETIRSEGRWPERQEKQITRTLRQAGEKVHAIENLSARIGEEVEDYLRKTLVQAQTDSSDLRLQVFTFLQLEAEEAKKSGVLPQGIDIGIQVYDAEGKRWAWAGWPQVISMNERILISSSREAVYTRQVSLYRILAHFIPIEGESGKKLGSVFIEIPIEANYKVNNKFVKGISLAEKIRSKSEHELEFEYYPLKLGSIGRSRTEPARGRKEKEPLQGPREWPSYLKVESMQRGDRARIPQGKVLVLSSSGAPLLGIEVRGRPYRHYIEHRKAQLHQVAVVCALISLIVIFALFLFRYGWSYGISPLLIKLFSLAVFMLLLRYSLLSICVSSSPGAGWKIFDPVLFANPVLWGLLRSTGDMIISAVFLLFTIHASLKIIRSMSELNRGNPGVVRINSSDSTGTFSSIAGVAFIAKAIVSALILLGCFELCCKFIGSVVVNSNPRLIGSTANFFSPLVIAVHMGVFLMLAGFFLVGVLLVWGIFRMGGKLGNRRAAILMAAIFLAVVTWLWGWILGVVAGLVLLFVLYVPGFIHREDLVSIVLVSFYFVLIVSGFAYIRMNGEYQELRKIFMQERAAELANPADSWKAFIVEDILKGLSQNPEIRNVLRKQSPQETGRLSFDIWAESPLSLLGYSSAVYVLDCEDSLASRFAVDMPFRVGFMEGVERMDTPAGKRLAVLTLSKDTWGGLVRFYRGIADITNFQMNERGEMEEVSLGKVVIDVPFFFENLSWSSRTGPRTPEILRNIQEGGVEPRLEEPEALLLARMKGPLVLESSSDYLPAGFEVSGELLDKAKQDKWPLLSLAGTAYRFIISETDRPGVMLLAGFKVPGLLGHGLRWSMLLTLYMIFTLAIIVMIVIFKQAPVLRNILPTLTPGRRLEFQQKLLASFFIVALLPAVILGIFSANMIRGKFVEENRKEALSRALGAKKALLNGLRGEFRVLGNNLDVEALMEASGGHKTHPGRKRLVKAVLVEGEEEVYSSESLFILNEEGEEYIGILGPPFVVGGEEIPFRIYYGRKLDGELLGEVSDQVGADVNVFNKGRLVASSREGLMASGLVNTVMNARAFTRVSLLGVDHALLTERAGRYNYQVAYIPLRVISSLEKAALGLPLLFSPESYHLEIQKATSIVFGIFALLFAATVALGLLLAKGIFEPLKVLLEGTHRIAGGDLSFKLPLRRRDEIGTVMEAFNEMTDKLANSQRTLEERRRYLETILANIGTGVISTDEKGKIVTLNEAAEKILAVDADVTSGLSPHELANEGSASEFFAALDESLSSGEPFRSSEISVTKGKERCTIKYMHSRLTFDGRNIGSVCVFEDLTELINSKKLSAWVEMARQIAHEIKNPLTPIRLSAQFMTRAYDEKSSDFDRIFKESSQTIIEQVDVLKRIAGEFSSFGKMQKLEVKPHGLSPLLEEIVLPYEKNTSGVEVSIRMSSLETKVLIEPEAFRKVVTNLIENALEAMPSGGKLFISTAGETVGDEHFVRISFRDTGPGLRDEVRAKLFEPYFSTKTTGTGLGLAICRTLSREMGGDVTVENLPDGSGAEALLLLRVVG